MFNGLLNKLGEFWVADDEEHKIPGVLDQNTNSYEISFVNVNFNEYDEDYLLLNGVVENKKLSLIIINDPIKNTIANVRNTTYYIRYFFEGVHYSDKSQIEFNNINIKIDNISSTIRLHSLTGLTRKPEILLMKEPTKEYFANLDEFNLKIFLKTTSNFRHLSNGEHVNFREEMILKLDYIKPKNIKEIYSDIEQIKNLFTFLTGKSEIIGLYETLDKREINIFTPIIAKTYSNKFQHNALLQFNENNLQKIFTKWFENFDSLNGVYDLYFSTIGTNLSSETLFLTYCQILESYHRKRYSGTYTSKEKFEEFKSKFTPCATKMDGLNELVSKENKSQFLNKVLNSIAYSYEYTLKDRLKELFNELKEYNLFKDIVSQFCDEKTLDKRIKTFCDIIKDGRNYYTHYAEEPENLLKDIEFLTLVDSLDLIIKLIFLKEFGLTESEINNITQNPRFKLNEYYSE